MEKVAVLPVPDCACAMVSWSARMGMMPRCWMADGFSNPYAYTPRSSSSFSCMSSNDDTTSSQLLSMRIPSLVTSLFTSRSGSFDSLEAEEEVGAGEAAAAAVGLSEAAVGEEAEAAGAGEEEAGAAVRLDTGLLAITRERDGMETVIELAKR